MTILFALPATLIPTIIIYIWLKKCFKEKPGYSTTCRKALINGMLSTGPIILCSLFFYIIEALTGLRKAGGIPDLLYHAFLVLAFSEELCKFLFFRLTLKKTQCEASWFDITAWMTMIGMGFGISESIIYSFTMSPAQAIVRGITVGHGVYGFITGFFYGKALSTGKKQFIALGFLIPFLLHGLYDFSLSEELGDVFVFDLIAVTLAFSDLVLMIVMIIFFVKAKKKEQYLTPLPQPLL